MEKALELGLTRAIGVSMFKVPELEALLSQARCCARDC
jgi:diketogulonate reductase-like aldo/keto reductase